MGSDPAPADLETYHTPAHPTPAPPDAYVSRRRRRRPTSTPRRRLINTRRVHNFSAARRRRRRGGGREWRGRGRGGGRRPDASKTPGTAADALQSDADAAEVVGPGGETRARRRVAWHSRSPGVRRCSSRLPASASGRDIAARRQIRRRRRKSGGTASGADTSPVRRPFDPIRHLAVAAAEGVSDETEDDGRVDDGEPMWAVRESHPSVTDTLSKRSLAELSRLSKSDS